MAVNAPEVQTIYDSAFETVVKVSGYYNTNTTTNTTIVVSNALAHANTNQTCLLQLTSVQHAVGVTGFVQLAWQGASANTPILTFAKNSSGHINALINNNASSPTGNVVLVQQGLAALDGYSLVLSFNKVAGYANGMYAYAKDGGAA